MPHTRWTIAHVVVCLVTSVQSLVMSSTMPLVIGGGASLVFLFVTCRTPQRRLFGVGVANAVTVLRLATLLIGVTFFPGPWPFAIALALDGLDGFLARRMKETSDFGALFDMETDGVMMSLLAVTLAPAAPWVVTIVLLRPVYVLARTIFPATAPGEPRTMLGRAAFTLAAWSLVLASAPVPAMFTTALTMTATLTLGASFAVSFSQLRRKTPCTTTTPAISAQRPPSTTER